KIGQYGLHQGLVHQGPAERLPVISMMYRLHHRLPDQRCASQDAIKSGQGGHFNQSGYSAPRFTHQYAMGTHEFDFSTGIGAISKLVLQPLDLNCVKRSIRPPARDEKTRMLFFVLGENQMRVGSWHGEKPFMADQRIVRSSSSSSHRDSSTGVCTKV